MPYIGKWVPAIVALAYVMRIERCDRATAIGQIETAARDGALRWVRGSSSSWDWRAEVSRRDLKKIWPDIADDSNSAAKGDEARPPASPCNTRESIEAVVKWHGQAIPAPADVRRLREVLACLKQVALDAIRARDAASAPADIVEDRCSQAATDIEGELVTWLARGQLQAFLETAIGLERLPYASYWSHADGGATLQAKQVLARGVAASPANPGFAGTVMVGIGEFRALAKDYLTRRGLADHRAQQEGIAESESAPRRIEIPTKRKAVAAWLDERYPDGIPAGTTAKHIARQFEAETGVRVDAKTVGRALGRP
jgi:hypothetical protein